MTEPVLAPQAQVPAAPRWRSLLAGAFAGLLLAALVEVLYILVGSNLREVLPGELYRCANPGARQIARLKKHGVRTIVCLRGMTESASWTHEEFQGAEDHGLSLEVLTFSSSRFPAPPALRRLVEIFDHAELPLVVHCARGVDRSGLACAIYLLLYTDSTLETALQQLSLRYLHLSVGRTAPMLQFFGLYAKRLGELHEAHSPERFRRWMLHEYRVPQGSARLELVPAPLAASGALVIPRDTPRTLAIRVWNESSTDLHLSQGLFGGLYLRWILLDADRGEILLKQPGGLREVVIRPGESTDLGLHLPPLKTPGKYWVQVELLDGLVGSFSLNGSDPLFLELDVR